MAAWSAAVAFLSAGAVCRGLAYGAGLALEPGGLDAGLRLLSARLALAANKAVTVLAFAGDLASAAVGFPAYYEVAAAAATCTLIIYSVGAFRPTAQRI